MNTITAVVHNDHSGCHSTGRHSSRHSGRDAIGASGRRAVPHNRSHIGSGEPGDSHKAADGTFWMHPPPNPATDSQPIWVDFLFGLSKVSAVDTVALHSWMSIIIMFYWNDPRLVGWPEAAVELPPRLWGPELWLKNAGVWSSRQALSTRVPAGRDEHAH